MKDNPFAPPKTSLASATTSTIRPRTVLLAVLLFLAAIGISFYIGVTFSADRTWESCFLWSQGDAVRTTALLLKSDKDVISVIRAGKYDEAWKILQSRIENSTGVILECKKNPECAETISSYQRIVDSALN